MGIKDGGGHPDEPDEDEGKKQRSPLQERPSHGGFDNLDDEFSARARSRENAKAFNKPRESSGSGLNDKAVKEQIDPYGPDVAKAEGRKEPFQPVAKEKDAAWTEGVDRSDDLPTGEQLADTDEDKPRTDRFRKAVVENYGKLDERASKLTSAIDKAFGPRPTGQAESRVDSGPTVVDAQHPRADVGSAASAVLAASIFSVEVFRWARDKIKEKGN